MNYQKIKRRFWAGMLVGSCLLSFGLFSGNAHASNRPYFTPKKEKSSLNNKRVYCDTTTFTKTKDYSYVISQQETYNIKVPTAYIKALKKVNQHVDDSDVIMHKYAVDVQNVLPKGFYTQKLRGLHVKASAYHQWVNNNHLTTKQRNELTVFTFNLLNHMRKQFGSRAVIANKQASKFGDAVVAGYDADNFSAFNGHDYTAVNKAAKKMGLYFDSSNQNQYYEDTNVDSWFNYKQDAHIRLSDVEYRIYAAIVEMMFDDLGENQMHGLSLMGLWSQSAKATYGAIGFDHVRSIDDAPGLHFFLIPNSYIHSSHMKKTFAKSGF